MMITPYFGKYRGKVVNNQDEQNLGQLQVLVPDVLGEEMLWAMPSVPYAGSQVGVFMLPPIDANIWVEFEGGDPRFPVWSGCFWGEGEVPAQPAVSEMKVLKTEAFTLTIDTVGDPNVTLEVNVGSPEAPQPLKLTMNAEGIEINNNGQTIVRLTSTDIQLTNGGCSATVGADSITLENGTGSVTVASGSVSAKKGAAQVTLSNTGIALQNGFPSINLSRSSVSVNNGALEVT